MNAKSKLSYRCVDALIPYASNSRTHTADQIAQVAGSIKEFGFTNPVLIGADDVVIAGHGRIQAAKKLGMTEVPCIVLAHLSEAQRKAYVIADNKLALNAGWDDALLAAELQQLVDLDFELSKTGFSKTELLALVDIDAEMPTLKDGDREPYQEKSFSLHDEQCAIVDEALNLAKKDPRIDTGLNENTNGNALSWICEQWLQQNK